jgi:hypothetical protein
VVPDADPILGIIPHFIKNNYILWLYMAFLTIYRYNQHAKQEIRIERLESLLNKPMEYIQARHFTIGRQGLVPQYVIIHWIGAGTASGAAEWFQNPNSTGSAHYIVEDSRVIQCVNERDTAWGADNWYINLRSINIEVSATPERPASETTYQTVANLVHDICVRYNIPIDRSCIKGHREVGKNPTECPGTVDIDRIVRDAKSIGYVTASADNANPFIPHLSPTDPHLSPLTPTKGEKYMTFDLIQKEGDGTVYFRIWPIGGTDSVLIPIDTPEHLTQFFGDGAWEHIQKVPDFTGQGVPLQQLLK